MKKIIGIYSQRQLQRNRFFWDVVFEWEDVFENNGIEICKRPQFIKNYKYYFLNRINQMMCNCYAHLFGRYYFYYAMETHNYSEKMNSNMLVQNIIDFYLQEKDLPDFYFQHRNNPFLLISSKEALEFLQKNNFPIPCFHLPLSLSDKYRINEQTYFEKKYDIALLGRQNEVLNEYLLKYMKTHPDLYYVYGEREREDEDYSYFTSRGEFIGKVDRKQYIRILQQSKVCLYSTPAMDGGRQGSNGFNQVTPRFLEMIACGCKIIARYPKNSDTDFFEIKKICVHTNTYCEFEQQMDFALINQVDMKKYSDYLSHHYTSVRIKQIEEIFRNRKNRNK